eukprot:8460321-Ditylum_brightwellii.AAC.1
MRIRGLKSGSAGAPKTSKAPPAKDPAKGGKGVVSFVGMPQAREEKECDESGWKVPRAVTE